MTRRLGGLDAGVSDPFPFRTSHLQIALTSCTRREFCWIWRHGGSVLSKYSIPHTCQLCRILVFVLHFPGEPMALVLYFKYYTPAIVFHAGRY